jgi:hypothetical protein
MNLLRVVRLNWYFIRPPFGQTANRPADATSVAGLETIPPTGGQAGDEGLFRHGPFGGGVNPTDSGRRTDGLEETVWKEKGRTTETANEQWGRTTETDNGKDLMKRPPLEGRGSRRR